MLIKTAFFGAVVLMCTITTMPAGAANCSRGERAAADAQLTSIAANRARSERIVARHMPHGLHVSAHVAQGGPDNERLLTQEGYVLQHDDDLRTALWVAYKLTKDDIDGAVGMARKNCFRTDPRLKKNTAATKSDYDEPIFDQGHMANDADMKDDLIEQLNTYMMSNMSPQYCRFNRGVWLSLEHLGRAWAKEYGEIYVTSGAIFDFNTRDARDKDNKAARMGSRNQKGRVAIPSGYYKIFLRRNGNTWRSLAFLLPHNNFIQGVDWPSVKPYVESKIVTIEDIEKVAEVTFHPALVRTSIAQSLDGANWELGLGKSNFEAGCK